jgi:hypothetical protein
VQVPDGSRDEVVIKARVERGWEAAQFEEKKKV